MMQEEGKNQKKKRFGKDKKRTHINSGGRGT
jgi:hypothetical protein